MATNKSAILKAITSIRTRGAKLDTDIHKTGVDCLAHAQEHGDVTLLSKLAQALPKSARRKAFVVWAEAYAPVKYDAEKEQFNLNRKRVKQGEEFNIDGANGTPFWDYTVESTPAQMDLDKAINGLVRSLKKGVEQGNIQVGRTTVEKRIHEALNSEYPEPAQGSVSASA